MLVVLTIVATLLLCWLVDNGFEKIFRNKPQHVSGKSVRLNKYYGAARASWKEWKKKHNVEDENEGENTNENEDENIVTDTLLTKILLGVYGCIPAYDINFKKGISIFGGLQNLTVTGDAIWKLNKDGSLAKKTLFYVLQNEKLKDDLQAYAKNHNIPFMKAVDMYFFGLGDFCIRWNAEKKAAGAAENAREEIAKEDDAIRMPRWE